MAGKLFVVATPIGNLGDLSGRCQKALAEAGLVVAEDTRRTLKLLSHLGIRKPLQSFNEHNQDDKIPGLVDKLLSGESIALVTDAGTPALSDPGANLVAACHEHGILVTPIPGPSAIAAGLSVSGFPCDRFLFLGFLPAKSQQRKKLLEKYRDFSETMVLFEAPHRVSDSLVALLEIFGDRRVCLCRELTKLHEEVKVTTLAKLQQAFEQGPARGEISLVIEGAKSDAPENDLAEDEIETMIRTLLDQGKTVKDIVQIVSEETGLPKKSIYKKALALKLKSS
jgi:16S rRNA (cytidine1402-2'-O)-methyltransferase